MPFLTEPDASPATRPATFAQQRSAMLVSLLIILFSGLILPVADFVGPDFSQLWPANQTTLILAYLVVGYFIYSHFRVSRTMAVLFLSGSCFYTAGILVLQIWTMPYSVPASYRLGGPQAASWLWVCWHVALPLGSILYVLVQKRWPNRTVVSPATVKRIFFCLVVLLLGLSVALVTALDALFPTFLVEGVFKLGWNTMWAMSLQLFTAAAVVLLWKSGGMRTVLTLWLSVALLASLCDEVITMLGGGRLSLGWYAGRFTAMVSSLILMLLYLSEIHRLYRKTVDGARQLRASNALLETRVKERTAELAKAYEELNQQKSTLQDLSSHRHRIRERERKRIAQEIHDELGQNLLALRIDVAMMHARTRDAHPKLHKKVDRVLANIDTTIKSVRAIINDLRPTTLSLGLHAAVEWQVQQFQNMSGIECTLVADEGEFEQALDEEATLALFRLLQESLSNIVRHSKATGVVVSLKSDGRHITLTIADNGVGIQFDDTVKQNSYGLLGMRERIQLIGGKMLIDSGKGRGTVLIVSVPIHPQPSGQQASQEEYPDAEPQSKEKMPADVEAGR